LGKPYDTRKHDEQGETPRLLRATCAPGLSPWLAREIESLGYEVENTDHTGVEIRGLMVDAMRLTLRLRTAYHVLQRFADLRARDADAMYEGAIRLPWERVIPPDGYVTVTSTVKNETIRNTMFANMRLKDAIVDRVNQVHGRRPDAGPAGDHTVVHLYWNDDFCRITLDISGRKLSDRGYRRMPLRAPMRETIAAAVLMETGYDGSTPLVVPMCGSGTIAIEAALIAMERAPGLLRSNFGVQHLLTFDADTWTTERNVARKLKAAHPPAPIIASDIAPEAIDAARKNAVTAGVDHLIDFTVCDFAATPLPSETGTIILHGEYGQRLGETAELKSTYARIGDYLKQSCGGWKGFVFTSMELAGTIGLKPARRVPFENGTVDCRLLRYELYSGSRRTPASGPTPTPEAP
jgi:putative N6-adenine-specific DNA methylase